MNKPLPQTAGENIKKPRRRIQNAEDVSVTECVSDLERKEWRIRTLEEKLMRQSDEVAQLRAENMKLVAAINWACGCGESDFAKPPDNPVNRPYWWRKDLHEKAGLVWDNQTFTYRIPALPSERDTQEGK